jgi:hypothetical protein
LYALGNIESKENRIYNISIGTKKKKIIWFKNAFATECFRRMVEQVYDKIQSCKRGDTEITSLVFNASTGDARKKQMNYLAARR